MTYKRKLGLAIVVAVMFPAALALRIDWSPDEHPAPTLVFDDSASSGFYNNADGEITFSCNGEILKREDELTREDLLAMIDFLIKGDSGDFGYFEALCPTPPPFGANQE